MKAVFCFDISHYTLHSKMYVTNCTITNQPQSHPLVNLTHNIFTLIVRHLLVEAIVQCIQNGSFVKRNT